MRDGRRMSEGDCATVSEQVEARFLYDLIWFAITSLLYNNLDTPLRPSTAKFGSIMYILSSSFAGPHRTTLSVKC